MDEFARLHFQLIGKFEKYLQGRRHQTAFQFGNVCPVHIGEVRKLLLRKFFCVAVLLQGLSEYGSEIAFQ